MTPDEAESQLRQFKRNAKVTVWSTTTPSIGGVFDPEKVGTIGVEITDLRIQFEIEKGLTKAPNTCDIKFTNLSEASRTEFQRKPLLVNLEAGYDGVNRLIFVGDVHFAMSKEDGPNWETLLQLGDGARVYQHARVNKSYSGAVSTKQVLKDLAKQLGQTLPDNVLNDSALDTKLEGGIVTFGRVRDELTTLLAPFAYHWSFQNGRLQILKDDEPRTDLYLISEDSGMIGTPEFGSTPRSGKPPHMNVKMFLTPEILPGSKVRVESKAIPGGGIFKVIKVRHRGDTMGGDWHTELQIKPV